MATEEADGLGASGDAFGVADGLGAEGLDPGKSLCECINTINKPNNKLSNL